MGKSPSLTKLKPFKSVVGTLAQTKSAYAFHAVKKDEVVKGGQILAPIQSALMPVRMAKLWEEKRVRATFKKLNDFFFADPFIMCRLRRTRSSWIVLGRMLFQIWWYRDLRCLRLSLRFWVQCNRGVSCNPN